MRSTHATTVRPRRDRCPPPRGLRRGFGAGTSRREHAGHDRHARGLGVKPGGDCGARKDDRVLRAIEQEHRRRLHPGLGRLRRVHAVPVRSEATAGRLLRRLARHPRLPAGARAAEPIRPADAQLVDEAVLPAAAQRVHGQRSDLRLPEGLVAARLDREHADAPAGGRVDAAGDVGAVHAGTPADQVVGRGLGRRPGVLEPRLGSYPRVHLPGRRRLAERRRRPRRSSIRRGTG